MSILSNYYRIRELDDRSQGERDLDLANQIYHTQQMADSGTEEEKEGAKKEFNHFVNAVNKSFIEGKLKKPSKDFLIETATYYR